MVWASWRTPKKIMPADRTKDRLSSRNAMLVPAEPNAEIVKPARAGPIT
jgi:hypothetical protein